jgi:hypothetical protein
VLRKCLDIAEGLIAEGREQEALRYMRDSVLPVLDRLADAARREALGLPPEPAG